MAFDTTIRRISSDDEAWQCADIMASTEPWITLGSTRDMTHRHVSNPLAEAYIALAGEEVVGVIVLAINVPLIKGYISGLAVKPPWRNRGIGARLLAHAEQRIFGDSPNVFLCVSSFNPDAQRFYLRRGYEQVGELKDFTLAGASELLMRKTIGPWREFAKK